MAQKEHIGFRVPPDTYEEFEAYREERNISKTDAGRRLLEDALEHAGDETPRTDGGVPPEQFEAHERRTQQQFAAHERRESRRTWLLMTALVYVALVAAGTLSDVATFAAGAVLVAALVALQLYDRSGGLEDTAA